MPRSTEQFEALDSGGSSVAGAWWFLIGRAPTDVFLVVRSIDAVAPSAGEWACYQFFPGTRWEELPPAAAIDCQALQAFIAPQTPSGRLDWNDQRKARDLFWAFRQRSSDGDNRPRNS